VSGIPAALTSKASRFATLLGVVSLCYNMNREKSTTIMGFSQAHVGIVPLAATCLPSHSPSLYCVIQCQQWHDSWSHN